MRICQEVHHEFLCGWFYLPTQFYSGLDTCTPICAGECVEAFSNFIQFQMKIYFLNVTPSHLPIQTDLFSFVFANFTTWVKKTKSLLMRQRHIKCDLYLELCRRSPRIRDTYISTVCLTGGSPLANYSCLLLQTCVVKIGTGPTAKDVPENFMFPQTYHK